MVSRYLQDSSFFTRREILKIYEKYKEVGKGKAPGDMSTREAQQFVVPFTHIENMPEFKVTLSGYKHVQYIRFRKILSELESAKYLLKIVPKLVWPSTTF